MLLALKRRLHRHLLRDPDYGFLFDPPPPGESVSIDCETTGLSTRKDDIVTVAAIRIRGNRILTSERFEATVKPRVRLNADAIKVHRLREQDVAAGRSMDEVLPELLRFIGSRPLVGFYLEFDVAMINRHMRRLLGIELPNDADRGLRDLLRAQVRRRPAGHADRSAVRQHPQRPRPADARPARRRVRRADDGDDLSDAPGPERARRPDPARAGKAGDAGTAAS